MQRKASKNTRGPITEEKDFQVWLKNHPCCITGAHGVQVHHCKGSTFKHKKVLIGHWFCLPLSPEIHAEYHAGTKAWREKYGSQAGHWVKLCAEYYEEAGVLIDSEIHDTIADLIGR